MRLLRAIWPLALTFALGVAGLFVPGVPGDIAAFVWVGVFPGLALGRLFLPGAPRPTRWLLGLALAPFAATTVAWALVQAGQPLATAARIVGLGGWFLFAGGEARAVAAAAAREDDPPSDREAWGWALAACAFVAIPMLLSAWARVRSDSWVHAGIVWEILERGLPPQDPRFAGLPLNYVWFYNFFIALLGALRPGSSPFTHIVVANACWIATLVWLGFALSWALHRSQAAARRALPLLLTGLNAGALLLWPLWWLRALRGEVRGMAEMQRIAANSEWNGIGVMRELSAPFAYMVNSWDKFMVGTALGYAYLLMVLALWAALRWLTDDRTPAAGRPAPWRWLLVVAAASAGMMLFHSVVGLSAIPVSLGASLLLFGLAMREPRLGEPRRFLLLVTAFAAGLGTTLPYFRSISRGWDSGTSGVHHQFLHFTYAMPWTLATACGLVLWLAWPTLQRFVRERSVAGTWLIAWLAGMTAFACIVHLPEDNEFKFVWMVFVPLAMLAAGSAHERLATIQRRVGPAAAGVLVFVALALPSLLLWRGFLIDRGGDTAAETVRQPGDAACYAWIRDRTPRIAVFLDHHSRDVLLVEGRRRLLAGTPYGPERAAFPREALLRRRAIMADLYGPAADLAGDAAGLDSLGAPVYVLYRREDFAGAQPWTALDADSVHFERVYAESDRLIYRRRI